jgi:hypothetical protein
MTEILFDLTLLMLAMGLFTMALGLSASFYTEIYKLWKKK